MADKSQRSLNLHSSPRHPPTKRSSFLPASASSADTQEECQKLKLLGPLNINKNLETDFDVVISAIKQEKRTGLDIYAK